jgi:hypothetical protein
MPGGNALRRHRLAPLVASIEEQPTFLWRPMFGCIGCYLGGRLVVVLADRGRPWNGLLLPVERDVHSSLRTEFPALRAHAVLPKWLHLPDQARGFAGTAEAVMVRIAEGDPRFGVLPTVRRLPRKKSSRARVSGV